MSCVIREFLIRYTMCIIVYGIERDPDSVIAEQVQMQGVPVGRAVDLTALSGYSELIDDLEKLFDIKGELWSRNQWEIVFTDDEGDMMLVGDDPWP